MKGYSLRLLPLLLLLLFLPAASLAAGRVTSFRLSPMDVESISDLRTVERYAANGKSPWTMFLPAGWDTSALRVWFTGVDTVTIGGAELHSGDVCAAFVPGTMVKVTYNKGSQFTVKVMQAKNQPTVYLTTKSGKLDAIHRTKRTSETGQAIVEDEYGKVQIDEPLSQIRCRGNSSFTKTKKKSYQLKLETKKNVLGMGKAKTWILISNFLDWSNLRNKITYDMAIYAGMKFAVDSRFVNVYFNGEYRGLYLLCEKVQLGNNRVDIADLEKATEAVNDRELSTYKHKGSFELKGGAGKWYEIPNDPEDITGGYLFRMDYSMRYAGSPSGYITNKGKVLLITSPKYWSKAQYDYLVNIVESLERAIYNGGTDRRSGKKYTDIIDVPSFAKKFILEEFSKNRDAMFASQYYYKPADEESTRLMAGPAWDYDSAWGGFAKDTKNMSVIKPEGFWQTGVYANSWTHRMYSQTEFRQEVQRQWQEIYREAGAILLGEATDPLQRLLSIDSYAALIAESSAMDYLRWPYKHNTGDANTGKTFEANLDYLRKFVRSRYNWLDDQWGEAVQ